MPKINTKSKYFIPVLSTTIVSLILILSFTWCSIIYSGKIYNNVVLGNTDFSGLTKEQAKKLLIDKTQKYNNDSIDLCIDDQQKTYQVEDFSLSYDIDQTVNNLYSITRNEGFIKNFQKKIKLLFTKNNQRAIYKISNTDQVNKFLNDIDALQEKPVAAQFILKNNKLTIEPSKEGYLVDKTLALSGLNNNLAYLSHDKISLSKQKTNPQITTSDLNNLSSKFENALTPLKLKSTKKDLLVLANDIFPWIDVIFDNKATLVANHEKIKLFLEKNKSSLEQEAQDAKLIFNKDTLEVLKPEQVGYALDINKNTDLVSTKISSMINGEKVETISLIENITNPKVTSTNYKDLGIKEKIATAVTSFTGSSASRITNIKRGAELFNGKIIEKDQTLSAIDTVGNPSQETGFVQELVIKGNKTLPEYGGGLCQVSTTLFRASMQAGLEILERTNHLYRVSYYEPPVGMDATIYFPEPDLVVKNNTPGNILVQTNVIGNKITFDLYGTKDNRKVETTEPVILETYNPPKDKYIESKDLKEGEIKRIESSHPGAKTEFNYKVTLNDKEIINQKFISKYKEWQAVYLFGPGTKLPENIEVASSN